MSLIPPVSVLIRISLPSRSSYCLRSQPTLSLPSSSTPISPARTPSRLPILPLSSRVMGPDPISRVPASITSQSLFYPKLLNTDANHQLRAFCSCVDLLTSALLAGGPLITDPFATQIPRPQPSIALPAMDSYLGYGGVPDGACHEVRDTFDDVDSINFERSC